MPGAKSGVPWVEAVPLPERSCSRDREQEFPLHQVDTSTVGNSTGRQADHKSTLDHLTFIGRADRIPIFSFSRRLASRPLRSPCQSLSSYSRAWHCEKTEGSASEDFCSAYRCAFVVSHPLSRQSYPDADYLTRLFHSCNSFGRVRQRRRRFGAGLIFPEVLTVPIPNNGVCFNNRVQT